MCSRSLSSTEVWDFMTRPQSQSQSQLQLQPPLKVLRLTDSMNPRFISLQILLALKCSSFNGICCQGLNLLDALVETPNNNVPGSASKNQDGATSSMGDYNNDENALDKTALSASYLEHLKMLVYSRNWLRIEFDQCKGIETLFGVTPDEADGNEKQPYGAIKLAGKRSLTTQVDCVSLMFPRSYNSAGDAYDKQQHAHFFTSLFNQWRVKKLYLAMEFTPSWTNEFCRSLWNDVDESDEKGFQDYSGLEELELQPSCKWHRRPKTTRPKDGNACSVESGTEIKMAVGNQKLSEICSDSPAESKDGDDGGDDGSDFEVIDCWELFCDQLPFNHPRLKTLTILCKTRDEDLAYLIVNAVSSPSFLTLDTLKFGNMCAFDEQSLAALARALTMGTTTANSSKTSDVSAISLPQRLRSLSLSRGRKLPSPCSSLIADAIHGEQRGLIEFCRALEAASALTRLTLSDYVLDQAEMGALFESLVQSGRKIERLSLLSSAVTSPKVYDTFVGCLKRNELPVLEVLLLPEAASRVLGKALEFNTSIQSINYSRGGSPTLSYYLDLNRGGRCILTMATDSQHDDDGSKTHSVSIASNTRPAISPSLYPQILHRAFHLKKYGYLGGDKRKHDVVYCLLRNRILLEL